MELVLAAIASGGLVGIADQYMCLLIVSVAARLGWVELSAGTQFMTEWWFIAIVALFWVLTVAPAYLSTVAPGVGNAINSFINFLSGFIVPVSAALIALASVGVITNLHPELEELLRSLQLFTQGDSLNPGGLIIGGGGALVGTALTGLKAASKPALSLTTGTTGHISAPAFATIENLLSFVAMFLLYWLASIDPWLIVGLAAAAITFFIWLFLRTISQVRRLATNMGDLLRLIEARPSQGWMVVLEFFIWGLGWLSVGSGSRGLGMLVLWLAFAGSLWLLGGAALFAPILLICIIPAAVMFYFYVGTYSARALMRHYGPPEASAKAN